jgi:CelD/BcsL family acetyltransferase involved in cellulose biosynthesis
MSSAAGESRSALRRPIRRDWIPRIHTLRRPYDVEVESDPARFAQHLARGDTAATPFQTRRVLETWYATVGARVGRSLLLVVSERATGRLVAIMPLVRRNGPRLATIEFADAEVSDYNAPILGAAAPTDVSGARSLWRAVRDTLAQAPDARGDLVHLKKMPAYVQGRPNPLALLPGVTACPVNGNLVTIDGTWEDYLAGLERRFRKELGRSWRVFTKHDGAEFRRVTDRAEAIAILADLEDQQRQYFVSRGVNYELDRPEITSFYRGLVTDGVDEGTVMMTALTSRNEVVSALLSLLHGDTCVMIRISADRKEWSNCSPGRLLIARTMQMLRSAGYSHFDYSVGNYPHKTRFGAVPIPLFNVTAALTPLGFPLVALERMKDLVRPYPVIERAARAILGRR